MVRKGLSCWASRNIGGYWMRKEGVKRCDAFEAEAGIVLHLGKYSEGKYNVRYAI